MADLESVVDEMMQEQTESEQATEDSENTEEETATAEPPETSEEPEAEGDDPEAEEPPEEGEESDESDDEGEEADDSEGDLVSFTHDGEEISVPLDELTRGYSGQRKVTEGFQQNAADRKALAEERQQLNDAANQVLNFAQTLQQQGYTPAPQMPPRQLASDDPFAYNEAIAQFHEEQAAYQQQQQQLQYVQQMQEQQEAAQTAQTVAEQRRILQERIPEFADEQKAKVLGQELEGYLADRGVSQEAMATVKDATSIEIVYKAMQFDKLQGAQKKVTQKAAKARPALKPGAKKSPQAPQARKIEAARKRLQKTGSLEDAVALQMAENPL